MQTQKQRLRRGSLKNVSLTKRIAESEMIFKRKKNHIFSSESISQSIFPLIIK